MKGMPTTREALRKLVFALASKDVIDVTNLAATINNGASIDDTLEVPNYKNSVAIEVNVTYNASATAGGRLLIYYSTDGANFDTDTNNFVTLPFASGTTKQQTFTFPAPSKYIKIEVINDDGTYALTINHVKVTFF
jgi:hypothetical protein